MQRLLRLAAGLALVLLAAACGEVPTSAPAPDGFQRVEAPASIVPGTCTNLGQLNTLAATIFTPGSSPSISSVKGKLKSLDKLVRRGEITLAKAQATEIVAFTLKKYNQGGLSGSSAQVEAFTNAILCFAGFDLEVEQPENTFLIMPSDVPQIVTNTDGNAGISFPGNPVSEPTLVEIELIPNTYPPGAGPLDTKLDQYPGYIQITKTSETNAPLTRPVVVGVCATGAIPQAVRDRLRLGHGASAGFAVTPAATASFISCPNQVADAGATPLWKRLASALLPRQLHAYQEAFGGGVGGTVTEFSPFAPVDPELSFGGGVGGTVTEFIRVPAPGVSIKGVPLNRPSIIADPCASATVGSVVSAECEPYITVTTRLGTALVNVPVTWSVVAGNGSVAARDGACGAFDVSAVSLTNALGRAGVCWTLGTAAGQNTVRAQPGVGGDAPAGVTFVPATRDFSMTGTAGPAVGLTIVQGDGQTSVSGSILSVSPTVRVTDSFGNPVGGVPVFWSVRAGGGSVTPASSASDVNGISQASWTLGDTGYNQLKAYINSYVFSYVYFVAAAIAP